MFYVYVLQCRDGSLYTGYTNDVKKRLKMHNNGKGAKYTRGRRPVELIASWEHKTKSEALKAEASFKRLSRIKKMEILKSRK